MNTRTAYRVTSRVEVHSSNTYYVWRDDTEYGPYTIRDVRQFWAAQSLSPSDFIRESHSPDWIDAATLLLPLLKPDENHPAAPEPAPAPIAEAAEVISVSPPERGGELGWGAVIALTGLGGLATAYFTNTPVLLILILWLVCLGLGLGGWLLYRNRAQLVLSLLFLASMGPGVWPTSTTPPTPGAPRTAAMSTPQSTRPGPGTLLGGSPTESGQTWTSLTTTLPGITAPVPSKLEATPAADLPPMPDTQTTAWTEADR